MVFLSPTAILSVTAITQSSEIAATSRTVSIFGLSSESCDAADGSPCSLPAPLRGPGVFDDAGTYFDVETATDEACARPATDRRSPGRGGERLQTGDGCLATGPAGRLGTGPDERERRVQPKDRFLGLFARSSG
jgi:hypothetical protein